MSAKYCNAEIMIATSFSYSVLDAFKEWRVELW